MINNVNRVFWVFLVYTTAQVQILKKCHLFYHEEHEGLEVGAVFASMRLLRPLIK
jgi:hypothetical protein